MCPEKIIQENLLITHRSDKRLHGYKEAQQEFAFRYFNISKIILLSRKSDMSNQAQVEGLVQYRAGDGPLFDIPQGPIEVELAADSAVVSWTPEDESLNTTIPLQHYEKYATEGAIVKNNQFDLL